MTNKYQGVFPAVYKFSWGEKWFLSLDEVIKTAFKIEASRYEAKNRIK